MADPTLVAVGASTLRGRFVFEPGDTAVPSPSTVRVTAPQMSSAIPMSASTTAKPDLTFEMKSLQGRVMIRAPFSSDWRLKRVALNGTDITDTGLLVPPNATIEGIVVELTSHFGKAAVRVLDDGGVPIRDCMVVVFPRDRALWSGQSRFVAGGRPNLDGAYQPRLPAGEYFVAAFQDDSPTGLWNDPDVLAQLSETAVAITIADDSTKAVDVKLGVAPVY